MKWNHTENLTPGTEKQPQLFSCQAQAGRCRLHWWFTCAPLASSCMVTLSYQPSLQVKAQKVNFHVLVCPTDPAVTRESCPGHPRQGVPKQVRPLSIKATLSSPLLPGLSTQKPFFPVPCILVLLPPGLGGKKALAWQLHTGGLCFSLGEWEQAVQCVLSHWSLVQTFFKACGSQQGSYVLLLIFTSIWSTLSKSTQWDLCRVINIPQLSGLPLLCSKSSYHSLAVSDTPGYCVLLFLRLQFTPLGKNQSFAWTLTHLFIKLIPLYMFTLGSELSDRWLEERISSEQSIASLKSHGNLVILIPFPHPVTTGSGHVSSILSTHGQTRCLCGRVQDGSCAWVPWSL